MFPDDHKLPWAYPHVFPNPTPMLYDILMWYCSSSDNLVFMNNLGGTQGCSGAFTFCGGFSQSYSDASVSIWNLFLTRCFSFRRQRLNVMSGRRVRMKRMHARTSTHAYRCCGVSVILFSASQSWLGGEKHLSDEYACVSLFSASDS